MAKKYEEQAKAFINAIKKIAENEDALENLESYLSWHFNTWLKTYANNPDSIASELERFSAMYDRT